VIKILNKTGGEYITIEDLKDWENQNSPILESEGILISTGWDKLFESCSIDGLFIKSWPGLHENAVDYLLEKDISLIGIDTVSIDSSSSDTFPAHKKFLAHQIPVLENLNNLELIDLNCYLIALPLNINGGSASPVRAIALV
jgi:kynurenine formamidase